MRYRLHIVKFACKFEVFGYCTLRTVTFGTDLSTALRRSWSIGWHSLCMCFFLLAVSVMA